jgi:hypothetical protein
MATFGLFKSAKAKDVGNSYVTVYTAPASQTSYFLQFDVCNTSTTGVQISAVVDDGVNEYCLFKNTPLPVGSTLEYCEDKKLVLAPNELLKVKCDTLGEVVDVVCSLVEDVNT